MCAVDAQFTCEGKSEPRTFKKHLIVKQFFYFQDPHYCFAFPALYSLVSHVA